MGRQRTAKRQRGRAAPDVEDASRTSALHFVLLLLILFVYGFYLAQQIDLRPIDLGRHLKNGELFARSLSVPGTNLYSYTHPEYPFVNHHWASGVAFFMTERLAGFEGVSVFFILLSLATFYLFFSLAVRYSSFQIAVPVSLVVIPVLISRYRIRPEVFTYFFSAVFLHVLWNHRYGKASRRALLLLPIVEVVWVNFHIYFFLGILLVGLFLFETGFLFLLKKDPENKAKALELGAVLASTILATSANPFGIRGALYPFNIMKGYEFPTIENTPLWSISSAEYDFPPGTYFKLNFALLVISWLYVLIKSREDFPLARLFLAVFSSAIGWWAVRNFAVFAYFSLPLIAANFRSLGVSRPWLRSGLATFAVTSAVMGSVILVKPAYFFSPVRGPRGIGLDERTARAAEFFLAENIQGPIFNNFDVGSYLIYYLYPRHRVFVDNRPEAYPPSFFHEVYRRMHVDEAEWKKTSSAYGFNAIFYYHLEDQEFIVRRVLDPSWAAVYMDDAIIILVRRFGPNEPAAMKYELPKERILEAR